MNSIPLDLFDNLYIFLSQVITSILEKSDDFKGSDSENL